MAELKKSLSQAQAVTIEKNVRNGAAPMEFSAMMRG